MMERKAQELSGYTVNSNMRRSDGGERCGSDQPGRGTRPGRGTAQRVFQGNVEEELFRSGTPEQVAAATRRCIEAGGGRRHIANLSHGVDRASPVANFEAYIRAAKP